MLNLRYNLIYLLYEGVQNFAVYISKKGWPFPETTPSSGNSQHKLKMRKSKLKVCALRSVQVSKIERIYSSIKNRVKPAKQLGNFIRRSPRLVHKIADIWHVRYHQHSPRVLVPAIFYVYCCESPCSKANPSGWVIYFFYLFFLSWTFHTFVCIANQLWTATKNI